MTTIDEVFAVGSGAVLDVRVSNGDITVLPSGDDRIVVSIDRSARDDFDIVQRGSLVSVHLRKGMWRRSNGADVTVTVPEGTEIRLATASGDIYVDVDVAAVEANSASGDVRLTNVTGSASIKSASGDIAIENVHARLDVSSASGDVRVRSTAGPASITTASGDIDIDRANDSLNLKSASGRFDVARFDGGDLRAKSMSGGVRVGIPPRRRLDVDISTLSGSLDNQLPEGDGSPPERTIVLDIKTVSGNVTLRGA